MLLPMCKLQIQNHSGTPNQPRSKPPNFAQTQLATPLLLIMKLTANSRVNSSLSSFNWKTKKHNVQTLKKLSCKRFFIKLIRNIYSSQYKESLSTLTRDCKNHDLMALRSNLNAIRLFVRFLHVSPINDRLATSSSANLDTWGTQSVKLKVQKTCCSATFVSTFRLRFKKN